MAEELNLSSRTISADFARRVEELSEQSPYACYQCGKCSAGCPFAEHMDLLPSQVLRFVQLGDASVLDATAPWVCASCLACQVRCPRGVDIARVMEAVRLIGLRAGGEKPELRRSSADGKIPQIAWVGVARKLVP